MYSVIKILIMTPKEEAIRLVEKYKEISLFSKSEGYTPEDRKRAEIVCNELIERLPSINLVPPIDRKPEDNYLQYWHSVKRELNSL